MPPDSDALLSIVIPVFNEAASVEVNVGRIADVLVAADIPHEFVLVDDGSSDGTWAALQRLTQQLPRVTALRLSRNFGKEAALCAGLDHVQGNACLCMDADLQHPPESIPAMYRLWREQGFKVVEGVKTSRGQESAFYRVSADSFYELLRRSSGINLRNASDFRLLDRAALDAWRAMPERQTFFRGMSSWIGFSRAQVEFDVAPRTEGQSKWSLLRLVRLALNAITSYSAAPLYASSLLGLLLILLFFVLIAQTLYMKFNGLAQDGFTTVIMLQLIIGGSLMLAVGVIGLYVEKIYEEVKGRPRYLIEGRVQSAAENRDS